MQSVSFGNEAHVQTTFGRVGTRHASKFPRALPMKQKKKTAAEANQKQGSMDIT
jgi:hypothetical protein